MSYLAVLQALEEGDAVTFNQSGGAIGKETPELTVQNHSNREIQLLLDRGTGDWWRVKKRDGEYVLDYDRDSRHADTPHDWDEYATVETIEIIADGDTDD